MIWRRYGSARTLLTLIALAATYFVAGKLGLRLAFVQANASAVWAPTGIALAALLVLGRQAWPAILVGAFLVNVTTPGTATLTALSIAGGNTLEAVAGSFLVAKFARGVRVLERPGDVFVFAGVGAASSMLSATVGVSSLLLAGGLQGADTSTTWLTWWLGDVSGALIVAPLILASLPRADVRPQGIGMVILLATASLVIGLTLFGGLTPLSTMNYPIAYLVLPILTWAAFGYGIGTTAATTFGIAAMAIVGTLNGNGPFARSDQNEALLLLQGFMVVVSMTFLALAAAVAERRRVERELRVARDRAEQAIGIRDEFLATASHELRTPLTVVMGNAQVLARRIVEIPEGETERLTGPLEAINTHAHRMERLVEDLLDTSRVALGKLEIHPSEVDLAALAVSVVARMEDDPSRGPQHTLLVRANEPVVGVWDAERLDQVITNLLSNAIKYSPRGGEIVVAVRTTESGAALSVSDPGLGIHAEQIEHLFEPFTRIRNGLEVGGSGLGLYIAQQMVTRHGGSIEVESQPGRGSTFTVLLPRSAR